MITSVDLGSVLIANTKHQRQNGFWVGESGATEHITLDFDEFEDYELAPAGQRMEGAGGSHLPIAGYGRLHLLVDQGVGDMQGPARELVLERVAHGANLVQHKPLSVKRLVQSLDALMRVYPAAAVIHPHRGGQTLIFWPLKPEN